MKNKIFTMLVLLMTAVTGARAQEETVYVPSGLYFEVSGTSVTLKYDAAFDTSSDKPFYGAKQEMLDGEVMDSSMGWYKVSDQNYSQEQGTYTTLTVDESCKNFTGTSLTMFFTNFLALTTINNLENLNTSEVTNMQRMFFQCPLTSLDLSSFQTSNVTNMQEMFSNSKNLETIYVGDGWSTANVTSSGSMFYLCSKLPNYNAFEIDKTHAHTGDGGYLTYKAPAPEPGTAVLNTDGTEASFDMPAYDVTVDYELVRDMSVDMTVSVEDAQGKSSIRLKKTDNGKYQPADMTPQQMAGLITVTDDIEQQELTNNTDYTVSIFAVDDNDQPTGTAIAFADLTPGRYVAFATAKEGTIYDGQTLPSNIFKLFVGYEVEVEAGQYATFYKDENLKLSEDTENAELRTITSVEADQAIVGGDFTIAPKLTPLIVHNTANVKQTILLIPTEEHPNEVQFASQFMGTLDGITLPVATNTKTSYALNGTQFVWVKYQPLEVPANKCWLEVTNAAGVKAIILVDEDDATGIESIDHEPLTIDHWYDLNGRKIQTPKQRGIYINNGRKVVVK